MKMNQENDHEQKKKESIIKNPHFQNALAFSLVELFLLLSFFAGVNVGVKTAENIYSYSVTTGYITTEQ